MKYTVCSEDGDEITLEATEHGNVYLNGQWILTTGGFKEFRRAVGYIWQEIEGKA